MKRFMRRAASAAFALLAAFSSTALHAQPAAPGRLALPDQRYFDSPFADPGEPRMSIGLLVTDVLSRQGGERPPFTLPDPENSRRDWQAAAAIGGTIPLLRLAASDRGGLLFSAQAGVFARFRIEYPSRDDLGQDWIVAGAFEFAQDDLSGRFRISHRSSHLGDEFVQVSGAQRVEFGGEAFDAHAAWNVPGLARFYGGASWIFRSYTSQLEALRTRGRGDALLVQLGADGTWTPFGQTPFEIVGGVDWQSAERVAWKGNVSLAGGINYRRGDRTAGFVARFFDGPSALGQFFLTDERYLSLEFLATF